MSNTQNRELSWLKFNERVLAEAEDKSVPLMERLRFVSIFTSNLDEFFMVRVGSLCDMNVIAHDDMENKSGLTPAQQLALVFDAVRPLIVRRDHIYRELMGELAARSVAEITYETLTDSQREYVNDYYRTNIRPILSPQIIDRSHPFPYLKNKELYAAALLKRKGELMGIVYVPSSAPPVLKLPGESLRFVRAESVVAGHLKKIFKIYTVEEKATVSVTRNADMSLDEGKYDDDNLEFLSYMALLLRKRDRLELQGNAPRLTQMLAGSLKLQTNQVFSCVCPLKLNFAYMLDKCPPEMYNPPYTPAWIS